MRILIIDDDELIGRVITRAYGSAHAVDVAMTAEEGIALHAQEAYEVAIVDVHLGGMDGPTAALRLQRLSPLRVLLMTGESGVETIDGCEVIGKPFNLATLTAKIFAIPIIK